MQNGLCDMNEFSVEDYEYYEKVENGDWNWITPNFIAFASPVDATWIKKEKEKEKECLKPLPAGASGVPQTRAGSAPSSMSSSNLALQRKLPAPFLNCLDYFEKRNIKLVVRLNTELYDRSTFLDHGIDHMELYFDDGTNPTDEIVRTFIEVADRIIEGGGVVAVHVRIHFSICLSLDQIPYLTVQSRTWTNGHPYRSLSDLEIWFHRQRSHRIYAHRSTRQRRRPTAAVHVPQAA